MALHLPYVDVFVNALWNVSSAGIPNPLYAQQAIDYGVSGLIFAFITLCADQACWSDLQMPLNWSVPLAQSLKQGGKMVGISFGGAAGRDLSMKFSVEELIDTYSQVIELYDADLLDFDLENGKFHYVNICTALETVTARYPHVKISFTLPVMPLTGIGSESLAIVQQAHKSNLTFIVNIMTMDYGEKIWETQMGMSALLAAESLKKQLISVFPNANDAELYSMIGITPMIGLNDDHSMFSLFDTEMVGRFARDFQIGFTAHWNLNRDNPSSNSVVEPMTSSNPAQTISGEYTITFVKSQSF